MSYSGIFKPKNPGKYQGDPTNIIWRSSWEFRTMKWLDENPNVLSWASEEVNIKYLSPIDGRIHRYFPDFIAKIKTNSGIKTYMIEVKPFHQTKEPEKKKRVTKKYLQEVATWGINEAKWKAAKEYCEERKWNFVILTEKELFNKTDK